MVTIGMLRETNPLDCRVAVTPSVVRHVVESGAAVWVETGAGNCAKFPDADYLRAGARIGYSPGEVIRRSDLVVMITTPGLEELSLCEPGQAVMAFFHMAAVGKGIFGRLVEGRVTSLGCEIVQTADGRLPLLAAMSEIAGQMTVPVAAHLLRSSVGGRGILLGGSPGIPPAEVVILGAGTVGTWAARAAHANGAQVTVFDKDAQKLRRLMEHLPNIATALADPDAIGPAVAGADVVIGAVLVAGARTPHVVTREMVETMKPGSVIIDVAIDQGGCVETSRPTTIADPTFLYHGVLHYCVPNLTADMGRSASIALGQALMPYLIDVAQQGLVGALRSRQDLARGVYTFAGHCVNASLASAWGAECADLAVLLEESAETRAVAR